MADGLKIRSGRCYLTVVASLGLQNSKRRRQLQVWESAFSNISPQNDHILFAILADSGAYFSLNMRYTLVSLRCQRILEARYRGHRLWRIRKL